jgi:pimeloyl-ACP methyl ester carboxylesterase
MADAQPTIFTLPGGHSLRYTLTFPDVPERRTILLSSLLATTAAVWDDVVAVLHQNGFRVLRYDHPGHGGSSVRTKNLAENTLDGMADDVYALVQSVGLTKVYAWIGCSLGAATGVVFAARHPGVVRRLVVIDTISASPGNAGVADAFSPRVKALRDGDQNFETALAQTRARWLGEEWLAANPDKSAWLERLMSETTLDGFETCIAALLSPQFDLRPLAANVASKGVERVLVVVGEKDADLPTSMEALATQMRDASGQKAAFHVLPNAGHASFVDGFDAWCEVVLPFLSEA